MGFEIVKLVDPIYIATNGVAASILGNTAGTPAVISASTMYLAGGNNVTLSQSGNTISINGGAGAGGGAAFSAGTQSVDTGTVNFANSNGVTFGMSGSNQITASVATNYQSQGAYLTTARASNDAIGLNTAKTNATWTVNSSGISFDGGAYLTTAQPVGAYLTTARASNDGIGLNTAQTNVTWTVNSSGISLNAGAYLTTAAQSNHSHGNPTLALTNLTGTTASASNGLTLSLSGNAAQTVQTQNMFNATLSGNTAGVMAQISSGTMTLAGGNNITLSQNGNAITISGGAAGGADGINALAINGGISTASTTLTLSNANNVSFGLAAGVITASASYAAGGGAALKGSGTYSQNTGTVEFANSNGITFGLSNNGTMTASHNGLTQQSTQPVAFSGSNGSAAFSTASFGSSNGMHFYTTNGSLVGSYTVPTQSTQPVAASASNGSFNFSTLKFVEGSGVTWATQANGIQASVKTDYQTAGAYLTTARASNDAIGLNTAITNGTWTVNSSGISLNLSNHLTTAAQSSASNVSGVIAATASNGATNQTAQLSGAISFANGSGVSFFTTASGATSGIAASVKTDYQTAGAYLTTARASNDAIGLNTAATNVTWTVNSSGISLNAGAYLTTAMASNRGSDFVNATAAFAGTNASGTIASNGISISVAAPGGGGALAASASNGSFTFSTLGFSNANNVTFGTSAGSIITASVAAPGAAAENNWFALTGANTAGNTTASGSTIGLSGINLTLSGTNGSGINISAPATSSLSATGLVSISTNGSTISIGVPSAVTLKHYNEFKESPMVAGNIGQGSLHLQPWNMPNLQFDRVAVHKIFSNASNSSFSFTVSDWVGIYTDNASTLSLLASVSASTNFSGSGTVGSYLSYGGGLKAMTMGLTRTLTEGRYYIGVINRTTTGGGAGHTLNQALNSQVNTSYLGLMGAATNASNQMTQGFGVYSATTSALPASIGYSDIRGNSSVFLRPPSLLFASGTV